MGRKTEFFREALGGTPRHPNSSKQSRRSSDVTTGALGPYHNAEQQFDPRFDTSRFPGGPRSSKSDGRDPGRQNRTDKTKPRPQPGSAAEVRTTDDAHQTKYGTGASQIVDRKPLPPEADDEATQTGTWYQDGTEPNEGVPEVGDHKRNLESNPTILSRDPAVRDVSKINPLPKFEFEGSDNLELPEHSSDSITKRIYRHLGQVQREYPFENYKGETPYPCSLENIEKAVISLSRAYKSAHQNSSSSEQALKSRDAEYTSLQAVHRIDLDQKNKEYDVIASSLEEHEKKVIHLETYIRILKEENGRRELSVDERIKKIHNDYQSEKYAAIDSYKLKAQDLEADMNLLNSKHESEIKTLEIRHKEDIYELEETSRNKIIGLQQSLNTQTLQSQESHTIMADSYESRISEINAKHDREKNRLLNSHDTEKAALSSAMTSQRIQYETQLTDLRNQSMDDKRRMEAIHLKEMTTLNASHQEIEDNFRTQLIISQQTFDVERQELHKVHENEKFAMAEQHNVEKLELEAKAVRDSRSLRNENEALKAALVKRDHFKAMSDHELAQRFQNLASEVEEFSRFRWDRRREATWPFPERQFRTAENERRSKQYLLQNTLWVVLYERIFCTPFRVLGAGGQSLEREWIDQFGQDRKPSGELAYCPRPTKLSEKWRYENMKKCTEATSQPLMNGDPFFNVKQGYESSVKDTAKELFREVTRVSSVADDDEQRMSELVKTAAKLWLEVGQQRCRMFLLMSKSTKEPLRSGEDALDRDRHQELVIVPELRRIGNAQGERLEKNELVLDCQGKFSAFHG